MKACITHEHDAPIDTPEDAPVDASSHGAHVPMADDGIDAHLYEAASASDVVSSSHAFLEISTVTSTTTATYLEKLISRTLAAALRGPLVAVAPRVWSCQGRDMAVRFDGFGPSVPMDPETATAALIETLSAPRLTAGARQALNATLCAIASISPTSMKHVRCCAPTPWRPAVIEEDEEDIVPSAWWTGHAHDRPVGVRTTQRIGILDPDLAAVLPRATVIEQGFVTTDRRLGIRLRPFGSTLPSFARMDAMTAMRAISAQNEEPIR